MEEIFMDFNAFQVLAKGIALAGCAIGADGNTIIIYTDFFYSCNISLS